MQNALKRIYTNRYIQITPNSLQFHRVQSGTFELPQIDPQNQRNTKEPASPTHNSRTKLWIENQIDTIPEFDFGGEQVSAWLRNPCSLAVYKVDQIRSR